MSGDYTRGTFRPERHYSSVRLQQGRVQVDADWNEAADIALNLDRTTTRDVVGLSGVPEGAAGFALTAPDPDGAGAGSDLLIGFGRAYVDGVLVEHEPSLPTVLQAVAGAPGTFLVTAGPVPGIGQWLLGAPGSDLAPARVTALPESEPADNGLARVSLQPAPAGATATMTAAASLAVQPDLAGGSIPDAAGMHLAYLAVFEREVTALDDPLLREVALGGPDTCLRTQVAWQVRTIAATGAPPSCKAYPPGWQPDDRAAARLSARGVPATAEDDPCLTPDPGGYRGIDNRLYRVEVHRGGAVGVDTVRVKWSRDNAIHRTRFEIVDGRLRVDSLARDDATALDQGQWVELQDEAAWRAGRPGHFVRLGEVNGSDIDVAELRDPVSNAALTDVDGDPLVSALPANGLLRRWEGGPPIDVAADTALPMEAGIEVTLGSGVLVAGDFWTVPARALTANVEWPADPASGLPLALPPQGVKRRFMALGLVERTAGGRLILRSDCRRIFSPLTEQISFFALGGDGQEALPNLTPGSEGTLVPLPGPLRVGVARGLTPLAGRLVQFTTGDSPNPGRLDPPPGTPPARILRAQPTDLILATDADGVAEARFSIHGRRTAYAVLARLLDAAEPDAADPAHLPIRFFASADVAAETAYDPGKCAYQSFPKDQPPSVTVQQALDRLCPPLRLVPLGGDGQVAVPAEALASPLRVGVLWGNRPLAGVKVAFKVESGDATVAAPEATTSAAGIAEMTATAGTDTAAGGGVIRVRATPGGDFPAPTWPSDLVFTARFAATATGERPRLRVREILCQVAGAQRPMRPGERLSPADVVSGFEILIDGEIHPVVGKNWFTGEVWVDVPLPLFDLDGGGGGFAFRPEGQFLVGPDQTMLRWQFTDTGRQWIESRLPGQALNLGRGSVTARIVVHGGAVFSPDDGEKRRWLDGALLFEPEGRRLVLPGGIGLGGSTLVMPFEIVLTPQGPRLVLVPLRESPALASLAQAQRTRLAQALDLGIDRAALRTAGVPSTMTLADTRADPAKARSLVQEQPPITRQLNVLLREPDVPLFRELMRQLRGNAGLIVNPVVVPGNATPETLAAELTRNDTIDLVFGDSAFTQAVGRSAGTARSLGAAILTL